MKRREAIQVLREICDFITDDSIVNCLILKPLGDFAPFAVEGYALQMKIAFSESVLEQIKSVAAKHQLKVDESDGYLVVYAPPKRLVEITA